MTDAEIIRTRPRTLRDGDDQYRGDNRSGIFVLPGFAAKKTGPSVIFVYLFAGWIVLPAALSKSEMATARPEAGGTYLYIDRARGPLLGTIAGIGAWISLVFKSAFVLVGVSSGQLIERIAF